MYFCAVHVISLRAKTIFVLEKEMRIDTPNCLRKGCCVVPTLKQLCGGQPGIQLLSVSKPSHEGCSLAALMVLMTGVILLPCALCTTFSCITSAAGPRHTFTPSAPGGKGFVQKKPEKWQVCGQDELEGRQCLMLRRAGDRSCT